MRLRSPLIQRFFTVVIVAGAAFFGSYLANSRSQESELGLHGSNLILNADSAVNHESFCMATGPIDSEVEGVFTLDALTGELQCAVMSHRTGRFGGLFRTNIVKDLGVAQNARYLMVAGRLQLPRGASPARPADSVVYVMDTNTGNFAVYSLPWRREVASTGRTQSGEIVLLDIGKARNAPIRD